VDKKKTKQESNETRQQDTVKITHSLVTTPIRGTWFHIAHTNLFYIEVSQKAAFIGLS
jgi:hypothetical protein